MIVCKTDSTESRTFKVVVQDSLTHISGVIRVEVDCGVYMICKQDTIRTYPTTVKLEISRED